MQQFAQKYAIIQLLEDMPVGAQFSSSNWPLHSTIVDTFAVDWSAPVMIEELTQLLRVHTHVTSTVEGDRFFGENGRVQVALLNRADGLMSLHYDVVSLLEQGGLKLNDPQFAKEGFLPHSTVQTHRRLDKGSMVVFKALSVIDFFPNDDPYRREVLATIPIGQDITD